MKQNMSHWAEDIFRSDKPKVLPIMTHPGIELIGKTVKEAVSDGQVHFEAIKALKERYPLVAAVTTIMDLTVESEAFGSEIRFPEDEVPSVISRLVSDAESIKKLRVPGTGTARIPQYLKAAKLVSENITDVPVLAGCIGPFSLAGRLFDMTEIMMAVYLEPDVVSLLLRKCTDFLLAYIGEFKKTGVNGVVIAEPAAGMLSEELCDAFSSQYVKELVEAVQDDSFLVVLHNCGNTGQVTRSMVNTGANGLHFGNKIDMQQVLEEVPANILVMGNLDPVEVFKMGNRETISMAVNELLEKTCGHNNFILSSGCDIPPGVSHENLNAFFEAANLASKVT